MTRARDVANLIGSGNFSSTTFTATAGQTAFTISHTQGFIQVFMNGLLLDETVDYTSNGSAVTLTSGAAAGDEIEVVKYNTFSVGDALNQAAADTRYSNVSGDTFTGDVTFAAGADIITATAGTDNVRLGENAGDSITSGGNYHVTIGKDAGTALTTADANTAVGSNALSSNQTANSNTAVGKGAGQSTTQAAGTYVGTQAGENTNSVSNTFIGCSAGELVTSGQKNTILGRYNGNENNLDIRTSSNNIVLSDGDGYVRGYYGHPSNGTKLWNFQNNQNQWTVSFKNNHSSPYGCLVEYTGTAPNGNGNEFFMGYDTVGVKFMVTSNGNVKNLNNFYGSTSDIKLKENIADSGSQWDDIKAVKVKKYSMKTDKSDTANRIGVIAQDLEAAGMNGLVDESPDIDPKTKEPLETTTKSVKYSILYMKAVKALQEAMARIETLETKVAALEGK